ncbi:MAG: DUF1598 domain-containing protein [Pirellulales bacterium]|nr:DUF1598 domain-containing protein [Pirellulales bacterium]
MVKYLVLSALWLVTATSSTFAQQVDRHLAAGEFAAAKQVADQLPVAGRDAALAQIATAQGSSGESTAAAGTIRQITSAPSRRDAVAGAGGSNFADFQSLMDLIQTTVVPDTWEVLGGPSTMAPYPQGVYVDAQGTVQACQSLAQSDSAAELQALLKPTHLRQANAPRDWRQPSAMRCVSLRRLRDEMTRLRIDAAAQPEAMSYLAGLSQIQYLFIDDDDIIVAGPVGGITNTNGWYRDRETGLNTLRLDFLLTCLASALGNQPFGCTIDPTAQGLQQAAAVAAGVQNNQVPIGKAAEEMVSALGMQRVEVFGTAGDTPIGYLMVEADRHMKQLALGIHPMPRGVSNYLDMIDAHIAQGPPDQLLLRLWFTSAPRSVRADEAREIFEISGTPIRLSGQNERALASGQRGHVTGDVRTQAFVKHFNENWTAIRDRYPVYGALESIYRVASISELLRRHADSAEHHALLQTLADQSSSLPHLAVAPRQVMSIAKLHTVRHGRKIHRVVLASGGVAVDSQQTLVGQVESYPSLQSLARPSQSRPHVIQQWWWDVNPDH